VLLADALPPLLFVWILCHHGVVLFVGDRYVVVPFAGSVGRFRVLRAVALSFVLFSCSSKLYSRSLTACLVVCNLCYEGSLIAASCNSLRLNDKRAIFPGREKKNLVL